MFFKGAVFGSVTAISLWALNIFANSSDIFTKLEAAEVIAPSDNGDISMDDISKKGPSRRDRFNFVAEVVTETGASLVYIKIKDRKVFRIYERLQTFTCLQRMGKLTKITRYIVYLLILYDTG